MTEDQWRDCDPGYMKIAIAAAQVAAGEGERPFGCLIVGPGGGVIGEGRGTGRDNNPTRHSEILAIRSACIVQRGLLEGCTLYSTHEPCTMCCGAIMHAKLSRVVWGSWRADLPELFRQQRYEAIELLQNTSHPPAIVADCLKDECVALFAPELSELANERASF